MSQVSGPVIAVGLVLSAVFVPCAFISGITGQFFRQFALTIATSTVISAFNSLTLSPALSALLLRPREQEEAAHEVLPRLAYPSLGAWLGYALLAPWLCRAATPAAGARRFSATCRGLGDGRCGSPSLGWLAQPPAEPRLGLVLPAVQPGIQLFHGPLRPGGGHAAAGERAGAGGLRRPAAADLVGLHADARPDSSPCRTRATCWSTCNCPTRPRVERTDQVMRRIEAHRRRGRRASSTRWPSPASRCCWAPTPRTSGRCT